MADEVLRPGQNAKLQLVRQEEVRLLLSVTGAAPLRLLGVLLDEHGRAVQPAPLLTWRQTDRDVKISLSQGETISAQLHTAAVTPPIQAMMFIVAPYARETFQPNEKLFTAIVSDGAEPMAIECMAPADAQQAIALCEFYRHPEQGVKIRALSEWRAQPLTTLLEQLGVQDKLLTEQMLYPLPNARKSDNARASLNDLIQQQPEPEKPPQSATIHQFPRAAQPQQPPPQPQKTPEPPPVQQPQQISEIRIKRDQEQRIEAPNSEFGPMRMNFRWHQPVATQARVKMDIGCLWELQNGKKGQLQSASNQWGSTAGEPYVALSGETRQSGAVSEESVSINGNEWKQIKRLLFYAAISEGHPQWNPLDGRVNLILPDQPLITGNLENTEKADPIAALMLLENRGDQMRVTCPGGYFQSYFELDAAFGFQLRWQGQDKDKKQSDAQKLTWELRKPRGLWESIFGIDVYADTEGLMRACLVAAAMVLICDGRVNLDERKNTLDALIELPIGRYFAQYEVRASLETILRDFKNNRKAAEQLALQLLRPLRGTSDARIIIMAIRRAAVVDGHVSIQEERMVERITKFLRGEENL